jgi:hypothetical protein
MDINNYLSYTLSNYYGNLIPTINQIKLLSDYIKKNIISPKLMYHLYSGESYIDFILVENGIEQINCIEPNELSVRESILLRKELRSPNRDMVTIYNINPLSNEISYSDADIVYISYYTDISAILTKINNECKINTLLIIESYTKPSINLKYVNTITITDKISIYIYKIL